jgi:hypothetical protein
LPEERRYLIDALDQSLDGILAWHATKMREISWCSTCGKLQPRVHTCKTDQ